MAIACEPKNAHLWGNLALVYRQQAKFTDARKALLTAIQINPELAHLHYALGSLDELEGRHKEALAHIQRAYELDPSLKEE